MTLSLNAYRDWRDMMSEQMFFGIYAAALAAGHAGSAGIGRPPQEGIRAMTRITRRSSERQIENCRPNGQGGTA